MASSQKAVLRTCMAKVLWFTGACLLLQSSMAELPFETSFSATTGYRVDELDWTIAAPGNSPNILSELTWKDLRSNQLMLEGNVVWPRLIALHGRVSSGSIVEGRNRDSDYAGNDRTFEFSRSNSDAKGDYREGSFAVGYPFRLDEDEIVTITPLLGYSFHELHLSDTDGVQVIPNDGPFPGLDSTYEAEWEGVWVGVDLRFKSEDFETFAKRFETYMTFEYHWYEYYAEADWNLRADFEHPKSFEHTADGGGWKFIAGLNLWVFEHLAANVSYSYQEFSSDSGVDKIFFSNGTRGRTRFNEVNWKSYSINAGLTLRY